jgi:hypothetical protein
MRSRHDAELGMVQFSALGYIDLDLSLDPEA